MLYSALTEHRLFAEEHTLRTSLAVSMLQPENDLNLTA